MPYNTVIIFTAFDPLPAADLNSNFANLDYLNNKINAQFIIPASAMYPTTTLPSVAGTYESPTNAVNFNFLDFADGGSVCRAECLFPMPADYNGGTVTARFLWTANSTSGNTVVWQLRGGCVADDEAIDVALGTSQVVADANKTTAYKLNISDETPAITLSGTPAAGELVLWRVARDPAHGSDTLAATARLIAMIINYTRP